MNNQTTTMSSADIGNLIGANKAMYDKNPATDVAETAFGTAVVTDSGKVTGIDVAPIAFPSTLDCQLMTTIQLGNLINGLFRPLFKDYVGCNVYFPTMAVPAPNATGANGLVPANQPHMVSGLPSPRYEVELYFQKGANTNAVEGAIDNIEEIGAGNTNKKSDIMARINAINFKAKPGKNLTISEATREMLDEFFLPVYRKTVVIKKTDENGKTVHEKITVPNYDNGLVYEMTDPGQTSPMAYNTYVKVTNLDAILLLRKIYGKRNELGHAVDYELRAIRPISNYNMPANTINSLLQLSRLDCSKVDEMYKALGMMSVVTGLPINRA